MREYGLQDSTLLVPIMYVRVRRAYRGSRMLFQQQDEDCNEPDFHGQVFRGFKFKAFSRRWRASFKLWRFLTYPRATSKQEASFVILNIHSRWDSTEQYIQLIRSSITASNWLHHGEHRASSFRAWILRCGPLRIPKWVSHTQQRYMLMIEK